MTFFPPLAEHSLPGRLRPVEDPGHGFLRESHARTTQGEEGLLRHENTRQTESK